AMADLLADEGAALGGWRAGSPLAARVGAANAAGPNPTGSWPRAPGSGRGGPCAPPRPPPPNPNFTPPTPAPTPGAPPVRAAGPADGRACVATSQDAHVIVDLEGTFASGGLITQNPVRALDTRAGGAPALAAGGIVTVPLGAAGVPPGARAAVVNLTATD